MMRSYAERWSWRPTPSARLRTWCRCGVKVSYGTIQQMLVEAEGRAARFNAQVSLGGVEAGALDEMFSQGEPVLAGVDLDSGYLFGLSLSATRDGEAWACFARVSVRGWSCLVVKDAARGIAAGVSEVFPHAEQRDDCFHVLYEMNKVRRRSARLAIEREGEALGRLGKRAHDKVRRRKPNANCRARGASVPRPLSDSMSSRRRWTRCAGRWSVSTSDRRAAPPRARAGVD